MSKHIYVVENMAGIILDHIVIVHVMYVIADIWITLNVIQKLNVIKN